MRMRYIDLIDLSLLLEGSDLNSWCPGWEGSATTFPACVRDLEVWPDAPNHLLSRADDALQSVLVRGGGSSVPDGDGAGLDALDDGCAEVHHHCPWQVGLFQL